jgi:hypothetical protein
MPSHPSLLSNYRFPPVANILSCNGHFSNRRWPHNVIFYLHDLSSWRRGHTWFIRDLANGT